MALNYSERRTSGILFHPTCLPGPYGVGDLGPIAHQWIETLAEAGQVWWQVLPIGPTGYGDSPYQSPSAFAGNLNLLSPELLVNDRLVSPEDARVCEHPDGPVPFETVIVAKRKLAEVACKRFHSGDVPELQAAYQAFLENEGWWANEYALFAAIKERFGGAPWWEWPKPVAMRETAALTPIATELAQTVEVHRFGQFLFDRQWKALRKHAAQFGIEILGDVPIYVAEDSADVWAQPDLYMLDNNRRPVVVAGVPPDYFSRTGQLWGNPIYDWDAHRETGYAWWTDRMRKALQLFDSVRIDHFRGIEGYWAVPAGDLTAEGGEWLSGPGADLLLALEENLGELPIVAEDLGVITPEVDALRERFALPGMRILQFAFGGAVELRFLPHRFEPNLVVYTGTHDNETTYGWFENRTELEKAQFFAYFPEAERDPVWTLIRAAWSSVARLALVPLQDLLNLGNEARLNSPGVATGNWRWRATAAQISDSKWVERLAEFGRVYERAKPDPTLRAAVRGQ